MRFAVYVIADGVPPTWHQVTWESNITTVYKLDHRTVIEADGVPLMEAVLGARPSVGWIDMHA